MVWAQSAWWWFSARPSLLTPSQSPLCTRWELSIFCAGLVGLLGLSWCHTQPACLWCSQSCWGTAPEDPWYCWWSLILAPCRWGWIMILEEVDCWTAVLWLVVPSFLSWDLKLTWVASSTGTMYRGLSLLTQYLQWSWKKCLFRSILNGLERTLFYAHFEALWPWRSQIWVHFGAFGGWSWKDTFTWFLVSMEVSQMVLKGVHWWLRFAPLTSPWGFAIYS